MSWNNRVVWSEGMFIGTQHFQQHDRYLENLIDARSRPLSAGAWGFSELLIDQGLLAQGKLAIISARGLLPDGTPFNIPQDDLAPSPLNVDDNLRDGLVYLALPLKRAGARDTVDEGEALGAARYVSQVREVRDDNAPFENQAPVAVGSRALRLLVARDGISDYAAIGLVRIKEKRADRALVLDDTYIPPLLDVVASNPLAAFRSELLGLLHQRGEALAGRVVASGAGGASEIADFMLLQLVNRAQPLIQHLSQLSPLHPERFYSELVSLAGEFSTFTASGRRPQEYPQYQHDDLAPSFAPVMQALREALSMLIDSKATPIPIVEKKPMASMWRCWPTRPCSTAPASSWWCAPTYPPKPCAATLANRARSARWSTSATWSTCNYRALACCRCRWRHGRSRITSAPPITNWTGAASIGSNWPTPAVLRSTSRGNSRG